MSRVPLTFDELNAFAVSKRWQELYTRSLSEISQFGLAADPVIMMALAAFQLGNNLAAYKLLSYVREERPDLTRLAGYHAFLLESDNKWDEAIDLNYQSWNESESDVWGPVQLSRLLMRQFKVDEALKVLSRYTQVNEEGHSLITSATNDANDLRNRLAGYDRRFCSLTVPELRELLDSSTVDHFIEYELWARFNDRQAADGLYDLMFSYFYKHDRVSEVSYLTYKLWLENPLSRKHVVTYAKNRLRQLQFSEARTLIQTSLSKAEVESDDEAVLTLVRAYGHDGDVNGELACLEDYETSCGEGLKVLLQARLSKLLACEPLRHTRAVPVARLLSKMSSPTSFARPARWTHQRRPTLALCISGQLRGFKSALASLQRIFETFEVTTFVSTWDDIGPLGNDVSKRDALHREGLLPADLLDYAPHKLAHALPRTYTFLSQPIVGRDDLCRFYNTDHIEIESGKQFVDYIRTVDALREYKDTNQLKMAYKIYRCEQLVQQVEASGKSFDYALRIRPDLVMDTIETDELIGACQNGNEICGSYLLAVEYHGFSDQFLFGCRSPMRLLERIWQGVCRAGSGAYEPGFGERLAESAIFYQLFFQGVKMVPLRVTSPRFLNRSCDIFESGVRELIAQDRRLPFAFGT